MKNPCRDHHCDECDKCMGGYCCGNDVVTLNLPAEGSWNGGRFHGQLGVLEEDISDGSLKCHCCGKWFKNLGQHARLQHGLDADQYRAMWGLNATQSLMGMYEREERRQRAVGRRGEDLSGIRPTPEQLSLIGRRRYARSQSAREGQPTFTTEHQSKASRARWAKPNARDGLIRVRRQTLDFAPGKQCPVCGVMYNRVPNTKKINYCGQPECLSEIKRRAARKRHDK